MMPALALLAAVVLVAAAALASIRHLLSGTRRIEGVTVRAPTDDTGIGSDGAVHSVQGAEIVLPEAMLGELWRTATLERLARTYWAFLSASTFGLIRVFYTDRERYVCFGLRAFKLLTFAAPEYETDGDRGIVRWRITQGVLVAPTGRGADGYLEIDVRRMPCDVPGQARVHVEVEVANFYPAIASRLGRFLYTNTQSRIHVIVTHGFLRRLAKRDLEQSVTGRYRTPDAEDTPAPRRERDRV